MAIEIKKNVRLFSVCICVVMLFLFFPLTLRRIVPGPAPDPNCRVVGSGAVGSALGRIPQAVHGTMVPLVALQLRPRLVIEHPHPQVGTPRNERLVVRVQRRAWAGSVEQDRGANVRAYG